MPQLIIRCLSFISFHMASNHWGWGRVGWRFCCFCWPRWRGRNWPRERINRSMFKLHVEFQGCAGCRTPESKSKEFVILLLLWPVRIYHLQMVDTRGGYPHSSTWNIFQRYKISLNQLQVEVWPPKMAFQISIHYNSTENWIRGPSCRISTSWSNPVIEDGSRSLQQQLDELAPKGRLALVWDRWGQALGAHDCKWNQQVGLE